MSQSILCSDRLPLHVDFDGAQLTSDGGLCWLSEVVTALDLCALPGCGE